MAEVVEQERAGPQQRTEKVISSPSMKASRTQRKAAASASLCARWWGAPGTSEAAATPGANSEARAGGCPACDVSR